MLQTYEGLCEYMEKLPGSTKNMPFDFDPLVFRFEHKMFCLMSWQDDPVSITLKAKPEEAILLRQHYPAIIPGYHTNKKHWNTVTCDGSVPDAVIKSMIDNSYQLVFNSLPMEIRKK